MTDDLKYKLISETKYIFETHGWKEMEAFVYKKDDSLQIFWSEEEKPSMIKNIDMLNVFDDLNQKYYGDILKQKIYDSAIELLTKQQDLYQKCAEEKAKNNKKIFKVRCVYDDGKLVPGRSTNCDFVMSELYGMTDEKAFEECKKIVNRYRSEDLHYWHVLDENDKVIY